MRSRTNNTRKNVLVTSISKKIPLLKAVRAALKRFAPSAKLIGADSNPGCPGRFFVDRFWQMPRLGDLSVKDLIEFCESEGIGVIFPTRDGELAFFAQHQAVLRNHGIAVMISRPEAVEACTDKLLFYKTMNHFPIIPTSENPDDIKAGRFVVKERFGAGSAQIGLNLEKAEAIAHAAKPSRAIFQPYIGGKEASVDLYVDLSGKVKGCVARMRDVVVNGESQITTTFRDSALETLCSRAAESLGLYGHVLFQVIIDQKGDFHIIECNCRFGGASTLSIAAGLDSFYWFLLEAAGEDLNPFVRSDGEKQLIRYPEDLIL